MPKVKPSKVTQPFDYVQSGHDLSGPLVKQLISPMFSI